MTTTDISARLAETFAPTLVIFPEDPRKRPYGDPRPTPEETGDYHPCPVEIVLDGFWLYHKGRRLRDSKTSRRGRPDEFGSEKEWLVSLLQRRRELAKAEINLRCVQVDDPTSAWDTYHSLKAGPTSGPEGARPYPATVYSRVVSGQDILAAGRQLPKAFNANHYAVQYWMFYYYNHWWNIHEMDWEMITLVVQKTAEGDLEPVTAAYSAHGSGRRREWYQVLRSPDEPNSPLVFVAAGSHASYFQHSEDGYSATGRQVRNVSWLPEPLRDGLLWLVQRVDRKGFLWLAKEGVVDIVPQDTPDRFIRPVIWMMPVSPSLESEEWWWMHYSGMWGEKPDK